MAEYLIGLYDRFSFDRFFRLLLLEKYGSEEAIDFILNNCKLSALVYQERIENKYYMKINVKEIISDDLKVLRQQIFNDIFPNKN